MSSHSESSSQESRSDEYDAEKEVEDLEDDVDDEEEEEELDAEEEEEEEDNTHKRKKTSSKSAPAKKAKQSTGHPECPPPHKAPAGQISQNTLDFLNCLRYEDCNQRDWLNDDYNNMTYKMQFKEFNEFTQEFVTRAIDIDDNLPPYPSKDLVYRLSRDLRFANDKTPYRKQFMMTFSKTGRKGACAGYHLMVQPNGRTLFAVGKWQADKDELANIRQNIVSNPSPLFDILSNSAFVKNFGDASKRNKGERKSLFGMDDELKVAPKGYAKDHPHIDLLKLRSFIVEHRFNDDEVTSASFLDTLMDLVRISKPLVDLLNDWMDV